MPYGQDINRLHRHLGGLAREYDGRGFTDKLAALGQEAAKDADEPILAATSGRPMTMRGWPRRKPAVLGVRSYVAGPFRVDVLPKGRSKGPIRVLTDGREPHGVGEGLLRFRGSKTKGLRMSHRIVGAKSGRAIGAQAGKGTWRIAEALMIERTMKRQAAGFERTFLKWMGKT